MDQNDVVLFDDIAYSGVTVSRQHVLNPFADDIFPHIIAVIIAKQSSVGKNCLPQSPQKMELDVAFAR